MAQSCLFVLFDVAKRDKNKKKKHLTNQQPKQDRGKHIVDLIVINKQKNGTILKKKFKKTL